MTTYCVPWALSYLTKEPLTQIEQKLLSYLGDKPISGIYLGVAMAILRDTKHKARGIAETTDYKKLDPTIPHLIMVPGHIGVVHKSLWFDNQNPSGRPLRKQKTLAIFRIQKGTDDNSKAGGEMQAIAIAETSRSEETDYAG